MKTFNSSQGRLLSIIIRDFIKRNEITQSEFAKKIGCTHLTVTNWYNGKSLPNKKFSKALSELIPEFDENDFKRI